MTARLRVAGLTATAVLAASAYLAGALPGGDPAPALRAHGPGATSGTFLLGVALWLLGGAALAAVWWRGTREATGLPRSRGAMRQAVLTGLLWAAPLLLAPPLASRDVYAYACQGALWLDGRDPYAAGVADGGCAWSGSVPDLWWHSPAPYGPLAIVLSGVAVAAARALATDASTQLAIAVTALRLIALCGLGLVAWGAARLADRPGRAVWLGLVTPLVGLHAVSGAHNDAIVAGLIVAGLAAAYRTEWLLAGVLLAGACAVKVTALAALPFALLLLPTWRARAGAGAAGATAFTALTLAAGLDLGWARALSNTGGLQQWTSLPTGVGMAAGYLLRALGRPDAMPACVTAARALGLVALAAIGVYALRRAWGAPPRTIVAACGWVLAATALLGPVFYPWYALAPLAVLACATEAWLRARVIAVVVLFFLVLPNGLGLAVLTKGPGAFLDLAVLIAVAVWGGRRARRATSTARA
jgi:hypothetical protein